MAEENTKNYLIPRLKTRMRNSRLDNNNKKTETRIIRVRCCNNCWHYQHAVSQIWDDNPYDYECHKHSRSTDCDQYCNDYKPKEKQ